MAIYLPKRIHIIGSVASGKTTLAKKLSTQLGIPYYELDNIVWKRGVTEDRRRTEQEREVYLETIIQSEKWIIEGVHNEDWVANSFYEADVIIFLNTPYAIRTFRIIKRYIKQTLGIEKSNYKPNIRIFFKMFKWNRHFESVGKKHFFEEFGKLKEKIYVVSTNKEVIDILRYNDKK